MPKYQEQTLIYITRMEPTGAGGASGESHHVATKQTDKGVAPQSPFEESETTSARWHNLGPGNAPLPLQKSVQEPLFCVIFS